MGRRRAVAVGAALALTLSLLAGLAPSTVAASPPTLVFATWNVCKLDCPAPAPGWGIRRDRVARVIAGSGADVVAVNEATNNRYGARTQWEDIRALVAGRGYVSPAIQDDRCSMQDCDNTARLLFRRATVAQLDLGPLASAGSLPVADIAPAIGAYPGRQVTWAYLTGLVGAGTFLAVSAHLTNDKSAAGEQHRVAFGQALTGWAQRMNAERGLADVPVILMGDLNSYDDRQPRGVQKVLRDAGWRDALDAPSRRNADINSVNLAGSEGNGWPTRPFRYKGRTANRIDYILFRGPVRARSYEVVVRLNPNGTFRTGFQASDHNMIKARLAFTAPVTAPGGALDPTSPAAVARPMPAPSQPYTAGRPFPDSTMPVERVVTWDPARPSYGSRQTSARARSDGYTVEAYLGGRWVPVPYVNATGLLTFSPKALLELGLEADPLGSVLPPPDTIFWNRSR